MRPKERNEAKKGAPGDMLFDTVIIECTGIADPAPILQVTQQS